MPGPPLTWQEARDKLDINNQNDSNPTGGGNTILLIAAAVVGYMVISDGS